MLSVADQRHQRLEDQATDLKRHLFRQQRQIRTLKERLQDCDSTRTDRSVSTSWRQLPTSEPLRRLREITGLSR